MNVVKTDFEGLLVIDPEKFGDARGYFLESWNKRKFDEAVGYCVNFVQDNHSKSNSFILRGLHIQVGNEQGKLVRVSSGAVLDVVVDLRKNSSTFGQFFSIVLSESNCKQLWIPKGFAHGFLTLEDNTHFQYKCDNFYDPNCEVSLKWDDADINIPWTSYLLGREPILSQKDSSGISFKDYELNFV